MTYLTYVMTRLAGCNEAVGKFAGLSNKDFSA